MHFSGLDFFASIRKEKKDAILHPFFCFNVCLVMNENVYCILIMLVFVCNIFTFIFVSEIIFIFFVLVFIF